jgi:monoamine oxidase
MVLLYTDRPATEYWAPYLADRDNHDRTEIDRNPALMKPFARYLARDVQLAARRARDSRPHSLTLTAEATAELADLPLDEIARRIEDSIVTYAIRDWSRPPYGAANHSWRPGVQSLDVRATLRAFGWPSRRRNLHVCGEAYSDYTGFIEGSLRTADDAMAAIRSSLAEQDVEAAR